MPKVRSPRGTRTRFTPARVQSTISQAYASAFGREVSKWRKQIQEHSQRVIVLMGERHGADESSEWTRADIALAIEQEIRKNAPSEVHDAYLDLHPDRRPRSVEWSKFEAKSEADADEDPLWSIQRPSAKPVDQTPAETSLLGGLGVPARIGRGGGSGAASKPPKQVSKPCLKSHWVGFWNAMASKTTTQFDVEAWDKAISKIPSVHMVKTPEEWWWFWQDTLEASLLLDPRTIEMWRIAHHRRERARICGQDWLDGSGLPGYEDTRLLCDDDAAGRALYRRLWQEHMRWWLSQPEAHPGLGEFDMGRLAGAMDPDADQLVSWASWQWMATCEGLWPLLVRTWKQVVAMPHHEAREPPQWAMMRIAMALALPEDGDKNARAIEFYQMFSRLKLIPSEAMLREAGRVDPRFCEDEALLVRDKFEAVQQAIHLAATETKWNGTVSIDWSEVRSQGAPVGGRRISQGVPGFLRPIDLAQSALGRIGSDRPVSVSLPIWHRDIEKFLSMRLDQTPRLQVVVALSDAFMKCAQQGESWWLLDPSDFPELPFGGDEAYLKAVEIVEAHPSKYVKTARSISASLLWRKILRAQERGSPFVSYQGAMQASLHPQDATRVLSGIDGVGAFQVNPDLGGVAIAQWPSIAVNLSTTVTVEGDPDLTEMRRAAEIGLRLLDNALIESEKHLSENSLHYRSVCLGAIGYYEAIAKAMQNHSADKNLLDSWVRALGEGWAGVVAAADLSLTKERGAAPCFKQDPKAHPFEPQEYSNRLAQRRDGSRPVGWAGSRDWDSISNAARDAGQRFAVRTVWAPFEGAATIAGVTPGGLGTLRPFHWILDERRQQRLVPSALLLHFLGAYPDDRAEMIKVLRLPEKPSKWPKPLRILTYPDLREWNRRLEHAALLAPWIDQGVCLTLPPGLPPNDLEHILHKAWMLGLANIRFETLDSQDGKEEDSGELESD